MAQISPALVKELRERTGSGMMECKRALEETGGNIETAIEHLRKTGQAKAERKASRTTAEGVIAIRQAADGKAVAMVEVNCETDFVAKRQEFQDFAGAVADLVLRNRPADLPALLALPLEGGKSVEEVRKELVFKIGENINVRRFSLTISAAGVLGHYLHSNRRIGVIVELAGGNPELAKDIAMQVAATQPLAISADQVPPDLIAKEREIARAQVQAEITDKPAAVLDKIIEGKVGKFLKERTLLGQPFVKNDKQNVAELVKAANARVARFERFELGEGIEKKAADFVAEVMAQARGS